MRRGQDDLGAQLDEDSGSHPDKPLETAIDLNLTRRDSSRRFQPGEYHLGLSLFTFGTSFGQNDLKLQNSEPQRRKDAKEISYL